MVVRQSAHGAVGYAVSVAMIPLQEAGALKAARTTGERNLTGKADTSTGRLKVSLGLHSKWKNASQLERARQKKEDQGRATALNRIP